MTGKRRLTLIEIMIVISIIALVAVISIPSIIASKKHSNEANAITALRTISTQQELFRSGDSEEDSVEDFGTLSELALNNLLDDVLGRGTKSGYRFQASYSSTTPRELWFGLASPFLPGKTGDRYFAVNHTGVIYYTNAAAFTLNTSDCKMPAGVTPVE